MSKILEDLYEGRIYPSEQYRPITKCYKNLRKELEKHYDDFIEKIDSSLVEEFSDIIDEQFHAIPMELSEMFIYGFRLGAKMMIEILQEEDNK